MKKLSIVMCMILTALSLYACNNEPDGVSSKEAEEIAIEQFDKDVKEHNETSRKKINLEEIELLSDETMFDSSSKTWEVTFNYKGGLTKTDGATNSIAQYSINLDGEIVRNSTSFE
ncbi:hypothetical protein [Bacillus sp. KH172YL63]|uniref:hypothetical protein n=1 Tax=Bacillus sp. KH172YL63 TaxID=2709784 RepID=UPI0013E41C9D|nr:hypothetical protein [Bacillus sp. KH172YL63]BCB04021.1 hypothetical protein KH172YL63_21540 [Bacillus sp. KH172YL63]